MSFLPPVENGKLLAVDHERKDMERILKMLGPMRRIQAQRLMANEGYTLRKALEQVGVLICERAAPKPRKVPEKVEKNEAYGE